MMVTKKSSDTRGNMNIEEDMGIEQLVNKTQSRDMRRERKRDKTESREI